METRPPFHLRDGVGDHAVIAAMFLAVTEQVPFDSLQASETRINQPIVVNPPDILQQFRRGQIGCGAHQTVPSVRKFSPEPAPE